MRLSDREQILLKHIRRLLPVDLNPTELAEELEPLERRRFLPLKNPVPPAEMNALVVRQISRSKASLELKLRNVRDSLQSATGASTVGV